MWEEGSHVLYVLADNGEISLVSVMHNKEVFVYELALCHELFIQSCDIS